MMTELDHKNYEDRRRLIEESVQQELDEAEKEGEIDHEENERLFYNWLQKYHQE